MHSGKVQQIGTPWDIYRDPVNEFVATFVGNMNVFDGPVILNALQEDSKRILRIPGDAKPDQFRAAFRPEDVWILSPGKKVPEGYISVSGRLDKTLFLGSDVIYRVQIGDGVTLTVNEYVQERSELRDAGDNVVVCIPDSKVLFFDALQGSRLRVEA